MRRLSRIPAILGWIAFASPALADGTIDTLSAATALTGTESFPIFQTANPAVKTPTSAIATYINSLVSGDCTATSGGAFTCLKTNGVNFTALATTTPGTGIATWLTAPSSANLFSALTTKTGSGGSAVFATGPTLSSVILATAAQLSYITGSTQCLHVDASGNITGTGSDCGSGSGAVSSVTGGIGITASPTTGAVVVSSPATRRDNTATTDTITSTDKGTIVTESNASPVAVAITTAGFVTTDYFTIKNKGAGLATYTPSAGTINGASTIACAQNQSADLYFDGTNYQALANTCQLGALATVTPGTGVATAAAAALSANGGLTSTIASGTAALGTGAITSGSCATVVTVAATNVATTDVLSASYNSDPTAVTGYGASATGAVLTIYPYPTSGNVNFKVCNSTSGSITPGAMTLNWRVTR